MPLQFLQKNDRNLTRKVYNVTIYSQPIINLPKVVTAWTVTGKKMIYINSMSQYNQMEPTKVLRVSWTVKLGILLGLSNLGSQMCFKYTCQDHHFIGMYGMLRPTTCVFETQIFLNPRTMFVCNKHVWIEYLP